MNNCDKSNIGEPDVEKVIIDGEKAERIRTDLGMTQDEAIRKMEKISGRTFGRNTMTHLEKGGAHNAERVKVLARCYGVAVAALLKHPESINQSAVREQVVKITNSNDLTEDTDIVPMREIDGESDFSSISYTAKCGIAVETSHAKFSRSQEYILSEAGAPYDLDAIAKIPEVRDEMLGVPQPMLARVEISPDNRTPAMDQCMIQLNNAVREAILSPYVTPGTSTDIEGAYNSTTLIDEVSEKLKAMDHGIRVATYDLYKETYISVDNARDYLSDGREFSQKMISLGIAGLTIYRRWTCLVVCIRHKSRLKGSLNAQVQVGQKARALAAKENLSSSDANRLEQLMCVVNPLPPELPPLWPNTDNSFELDFYTRDDQPF